MNLGQLLSEGWGSWGLQGGQGDLGSQEASGDAGIFGWGGGLLASWGSKPGCSQTFYTAQDGPTIKNHPAPDVNGAEMAQAWSGMCVTRSMTDLWGVRVCVCAWLCVI